MGKFSTILLVLYITYYGGNIVYDLFLKKEKKNKDSEALEEFDLSQYAEDNAENVASVEIDEVESIKTPTDNDEFVVDEKTVEQAPNLDEMRRKFEAEQDIEDTWNGTSKEENREDDKKRRQREIRERNREYFRKMLEKAETSVQLVGNVSGQKVYQSMI